jgi:hypothetical protein
VDWNQVSGRYAPFLLNNAAWCLALMGEGARAIPLAERAVGEKTYRTRLDRFLGTLGTALSVAGRHDEAVPRLEDAMRLGGKPRVQAVRAYFLGLSVLARGDTTRAREMFERTVRDAPGTRWASRATERLASMVPYR